MKVLIIGNGIAGYSAASTIKNADKDAEVTLLAKETDALYSPCVLPHYVSGKIAREKTFVRSHDDYRKLGIRPEFGCEAKEIDTGRKCVILGGGASLTYDKLILALGSDAIKVGRPMEGIFSLKTLADADALIHHGGDKAVVVGSGAIGIEIATALKNRGCCVTVIEALERLLPLGLDAAGSIRVKDMLAQGGIDVLLEERAVEVEGDEKVEGLVTDKRHLECDTLVWAVGMRPNVKLAKQADIALGDKGGIQVDVNMKTSDPNIYACGDCVETIDLVTREPALNLFWHNANRQGKIAGLNCLNRVKSYQGSQNILNLEIFGNHVVGFGYTESALRHMLQADSPMAEEKNQISIMEKEKDGRYQRLVFVGDRCMGAQFINPGKDLGLIWRLISCGVNIDSLCKSFDCEALMEKKKWRYRVKRFF